MHGRFVGWWTEYLGAVEHMLKCIATRFGNILSIFFSISRVSKQLRELNESVVTLLKDKQKELTYESVSNCRLATFDNFNSSINCTGTNACQYAVFRNVSSVVCGGSTCRQAQFINVDQVDCFGSGCHSSVFRNVSRIECHSGMGSDYPCYRIKVVNASSVVCPEQGCYYLDVLETHRVYCDGYYACNSMIATNSNGDYTGIMCTGTHACRDTLCGDSACYVN